MNPAFPPEAPPEPPKPPAGSSSAPLPYGYFGSGFYSCRVARGSLKAGPAHQGPFPVGDKFLEAPGGGEDFQSRPAEFAFYPGYGAPYPPVGGFHLDVAVLGEPRAEGLLAQEPGGCPQAWHGWAGQVCCAKEQGQPGFLLKPACAEAAGPCPAEGCALRRGRKKRVPYSKAQLRELEREFSGSRFITRERRRRIAAATGLSERQVTIWFQNRRVKDKKVLAKGKAGAGGTP
ncbi:homeobox protein Hox-B13-like [Onychostruthus taczanowskii]|uniref:homeobox protein Hox-B13-like n=1 Tax=Onychostruthus taczanowskii TaxID=356909 RepID=UPI001B80412F|nr:homeobox protein Hox-B13-like [Onychostruthus taczanowskii]